MVHISTSAHPRDIEPVVVAPTRETARAESARTVTLYMCSPRHQFAEPIDATPDMTLHDVVRRSAHLHWLVGSKDIDRLDVCVNGIPRHITDTLGFADSVEVYPARSFGCVDG